MRNKIGIRAFLVRHWYTDSVIFAESAGAARWRVLLVCREFFDTHAHIKNFSVKRGPRFDVLIEKCRPSNGRPFEPFGIDHMEYMLEKHGRPPFPDEMVFVFAAPFNDGPDGKELPCP